MNNVKRTIGWADWTVNPVKGLCPVGCSYCYARRIYSRNCNDTFKDKAIRYDHSVLVQIRQSKPGDRIFVGSTIDLFHEKTIGYLHPILNACEKWKDRTFIFLTKCPENLPKEFPDNCWVGCSVPDIHHYYVAMNYLPEIKAPIRFISFEPLIEQIGIPGTMFFDRINWAIVGLQTPYSPKTAPKIEWIKGIVDAADKAKIPVFLKDNLNPIFAANGCALYKKYKNTFFTFKDFLPNGKTSWHLRQEFPKIATAR